MTFGLPSHPYAEMALLLILVAFAGLLATRIKQPVLIAYILVGILVGPSALDLVQSHDQISLLSKLGVTVLLFIVGLKLDLNHVRHIGPVALATGLGQLAFTICFGFVLTLVLGRPLMEALYVSVALTFSSTIIIIKLLSDKQELDSLHGRIAVGFLVVQDIAVVLAMMIMSAMPGVEGGGAVLVVSHIAIRLLVAGVGLFLLMKYILPKVVQSFAKSQELLVLFAIAWGMSLAALGEWAGFSHEAGAFLAGFSLASTNYREAINARLTSIRDFMLLFFFIDLGSKLNLSDLGGEIAAASVLSLFVLIGNPLIVMAIMGYMGYRRRTGFLAGLTVAQISEFSIVFVAMGISLGHIEMEALSLTTLVGLVTITVSTYMILYSQRLYERLSPWLRIFERKIPYREEAMEGQKELRQQPQVIVFGVGRYGQRLLANLHQQGVVVLGVDFDPEVVRRQAAREFCLYYGDGEDYDFLSTLPLQEARMVVAALPDWESNHNLLKGLRHLGFKGQVVGVARDQKHFKAFSKEGVDEILNPFVNAADFAAQHLYVQLIPVSS